jgi:CheY-like chemotaxis protein
VPKSILIVDDNETSRRAVRSVLQAETAFEICGEAADGIEAIEKVRELKPDLIILDFSMPRMNGLEVARHLRARNSSVPIILFSLHADVFPQDQAARLRLVVLSKTGRSDALARQAEALLS